MSRLTRALQRTAAPLGSRTVPVICQRLLQPTGRFPAAVAICGMARPDFIREQLSATQALIKFLADHQGGMDEDLRACLGALEREDIDAAVQHARLVKPWGMGSLTDWCPPIVQPLETREHNTAVLHALVAHWCSRMSLSFDELDRTQRDLQVGELDARVNSKGYVWCPFCHKTFSSASPRVGTVRGM